MVHFYRKDTRANFFDFTKQDATSYFFSTNDLTIKWKYFCRSDQTVFNNEYYAEHSVGRCLENINIFQRRFFLKFFQNISYVKNAFETQFTQLKHNKNSYRFSHFLKNIKNAFKNQSPWVKLKIKICTGFCIF